MDSWWLTWWPPYRICDSNPLWILMGPYSYILIPSWYSADTQLSYDPNLAIPCHTWTTCSLFGAAMHFHSVSCGFLKFGRSEPKTSTWKAIAIPEALRIDPKTEIHFFHLLSCLILCAHFITCSLSTKLPTSPKQERCLPAQAALSKHPPANDKHLHWNSFDPILFDTKTY